DTQAASDNVHVSARGRELAMKADHEVDSARVERLRASIEAGHGTGFLFEEYAADAMVAACREAITLFKQHPKAWSALMQNAMQQNFSWQRSAEEFEELYRSLE
ncbi:MAG TPA: hypothetical protein PKH51_12580, partial [Candidatus Sumerlaeota bacterium]|nr:hypothetical protein [Candidatus Sumerlaeota bacterium]